tara:strand:+ start:2924 stop:3370 length:447 start_codon:yes stop_codon:yes gene_type:complete
MKPKIPTKKVDSSGCVINIGRKIVGGRVVEEGTAYPIHKGEWVEILPVTSIGEYIEYSKLLGGNWDDLAADDKADHLREMGATVNQAFDKMVHEVSKRVYDWDWTDLRGDPLPKPHNNPQVIAALSVDEVIWLMSQAEFEPEIERKNA